MTNFTRTQVTYPRMVVVVESAEPSRVWIIGAVLAFIIPTVIVVGTLLLASNPDLGRQHGPRIDQSWVSPSPAVRVG